MKTFTLKMCVVFLFSSTLTEIRCVVKRLIPLFLLVDVINYPSIQTHIALTALLHGVMQTGR